MISELVDSILVFDKINQKHTKPGALLRGIRIREGMSQKELGQKLCVSQTCVYLMEYGKLKISSVIANRISKLFDVDSHSFLKEK